MKKFGSEPVFDNKYFKTKSKSYHINIFMVRYLKKDPNAFAC